MKALTVIAPGSKVKLASDLEALVLAVLIRGPLVQYEVAWIADSDHKSCFVESFEIVNNEGETMEVGFR